MYEGKRAMSESEKHLESLYPFLHGVKKNTVAEEAALLHSIHEKVTDNIEAKQRYFEAQVGLLHNASRQSPRLISRVASY